MEEQNNQINENQNSEVKREELSKQEKPSSQKTKTVILISSIAVAIISITVMLVVLLIGNNNGNNSSSDGNNSSNSNNNNDTSTSTHTHSYGEWQTVKEATCTEDGVNIRECDDCGESQSITIYTLGHTWVEASCTSPKICTNCAITEGTALKHTISNTTSKCVDCNTFEYNIGYAIRGTIEKTVLPFLNEYTDSYKIRNVYYTNNKKCACDECRLHGATREYYLTVIVFYEYTINGFTYLDTLIFGIHKEYDEKNDTHYYNTLYTQEYNFNYIDKNLTSIEAKDKSFVYDEEDLIVVPRRILTNLLPNTTPEFENSDSSACTHSSCKENGPFYCQGNIDNCHYTTNCEFVLYCDICNKADSSLSSCTHEMVDGKCVKCNQWMKLNISIPEAPLVTIDRYAHALKFTSFSFGWNFDSNTSFDLYLYYDAEMLYGGNNTSCYFRYKVIDSDGYIVNSGVEITTDLSTGDKVRNQYVCVANNLNPQGSYTIIISDYN